MTEFLDATISIITMAIMLVIIVGPFELAQYLAERKNHERK